VVIFWVISSLGSLLESAGVSKVPISELVSAVKDNKVESLVVSDDEIVAQLKDDKKYNGNNQRTNNFVD
jgi:hypothetical protein